MYVFYLTSQPLRLTKTLSTGTNKKIIRWKLKHSAPLQSHSFIHKWLYSPSLGPGLFFTFVIFFLTQTVGLLGQLISPSQGHYLNTRQHKHRTNAHTDIHALNGIRTHDPRVRASENSTYLNPCSHRDRLSKTIQ
jgi:hypothetical protein